MEDTAKTIMKATLKTLFDKYTQVYNSSNNAYWKWREDTNNQEYKQKYLVTDGITTALAEVYGIIWYSTPEEIAKEFKHPVHVN